MGPQQNELLDVLATIREYFLLADADFVYSPWDTQEEAIAAIDAVASGIRAGNLAVARRANILFAPTGSIQEVSVDSGWGDEFLKLAERWDVAMGIVQAKAK